MDIYLIKNILSELLKKSDFVKKLEADSMDDYISVTCFDGSLFNLQLHEIEFSSIIINNEIQKDSSDKITEHYLETHSRKELLNNLNGIMNSNPTYFHTFAVLWKLNEMSIISKTTFNSIMMKLNY